MRKISQYYHKISLRKKNTVQLSRNIKFHNVLQAIEVNMNLDFLITVWIFDRLDMMTLSLRYH